MSGYRIAAIARRIVTQFRRDRRTLILIFAVPLIVLSLVDYRAGQGRIIRHLTRALGRHRALRLLPRYYEHLGLLIVELARMWHPRQGDFAACIDSDGIERLEAVMASGRGVICITGHLGCWEFAGHCLAAHGVPLHALYRPLKNRHFDRHLRALRERSGMIVH